MRSNAEARGVECALAEALGQTIDALRFAREQVAYQGALFGGVAFEPTPPELSHVFDPGRYWLTKHYEGRKRFEKHLVLDRLHHMNGDEETCAVALDTSRHVDVWVRNIEQLPSAFKLQLLRNFFSDVVARRTDGQVIVVEHKGSHIAGSERDNTEEKRMAGEKWARVTGGQFVLAMDGDVKLIERALAG